MDDQSIINNKLEQPPLIEYFAIKGLYGYKDISINFEKNVKIIAADNGAGKTTLLHTLYAVLTKNTKVIKQLNYKKIEIKLYNKKKLILEKKYKYPEIEKFIKSFQLEDTQKIKVLETIESELNLAYQHRTDKLEGYHRFPIRIIIRRTLEKLMENFQEEGISPQIFIESHDDLEDLLIKSFKMLEDEYEDEDEDDYYFDDDDYNKFFLEIRLFLFDNNIKILYQPTFRRIEKHIPEFTQIYSDRNNIRYRSPNNVERSDLIQFGLDDVKNNINKICEKIRNITLKGYNKLSANILELFLISKRENSENYDKKVLIDTLTLFLNRLGKKQREIDKYVKSFESKYSENNNGEIVLFLKQLVPVFKESNDLEEKISSFAKVINSYLLYDSYKEKEFIFDTNKVTAKVINKETSQELNLNSLSSGEKQIFSIFSKLYLENNNDEKYIILFDEPELSLSLEWQEKFLPDIFMSPSCTQLFAITHSPFIFNNALKECSGSMEIRRTKKR